MITVVDYGSGNLRSVYNALRYIGEDVKICENPGEIDSAEKIVLPGVGSSKDAMEGLASRGYLEKLVRNIEKGKPFLGICLGLQLLFDSSEESRGTSCLGLVPGAVRLFPRKEGLKVPQIGWNTVELSKNNCPLFEGIPSGEYFYFVHSYYCPYIEEYTAAFTDYGLKYTSALWKGNTFAVQFHPERSQENGMKILRNFSKL
ncbi:MAG TPA: imidazole glycerol phosphate synthase subunit HisH [Candidatus Omnitrophota bacterium]|nr:imidazole glycerol phosphate synthase subunit HisH [Candidatus Omnitrophota bacterium]